jgi:hypothetical protein
MGVTISQIIEHAFATHALHGGAFVRDLIVALMPSVCHGASVHLSSLFIRIFL